MIPALFDAHCDTISGLWARGEHLEQNSGHVDLNRAAIYPHYVQFFAAYTNIGAKPLADITDDAARRQAIRERLIEADAEVYDRFHALVQYFYQEVRRNHDRVIACRTIEDLDRARAEGKVAAILTVEEGAQLDMTVEEAYEIGVRAIALTWNYRNIIGGSNLSGGGLTEYGREFVKKMQKLGILVDVSHSSEEVFYDVVKLAEKPFIASHSNSRTICQHPRNLTDEQFVALCRAGGVAGFNFASHFVTPDGVSTLNDCVDHIEHFLSLGGARHIAMGGDLDGISSAPDGINGVQDVCKLADAMAARGISVSQIEDIFYNNLYRVVKEAW
ncbi:MAG: membrane dipeptidase [Clostridia bacterium]|nr:membrane dipeptidase [Clostridia bacterium]